MKSIVLIFFVFTTVMSAKDILLKYLVSKGVTVPTLLVGIGLIMLLASLVAKPVTGFNMKPKNTKMQSIRLLVSVAVWILSIFSFKFLSATSISIFGKVVIPILILLAPLFGDTYTKEKRKYAYLSLGVLFIYAAQAIWNGESWFGFLFVLSTTLILTAEYIMLRNTTKDESQLLVTIIPSIACVIGGIIINVITGDGWFYGSMSNLPIIALLGGVIFTFYWLSTLRYKLLPLGVSEYPSLLSIVFIMIGEAVFVTGQINMTVFLTGCICAMVMSKTVYIKK